MIASHAATLKKRLKWAASTSGEIGRKEDLLYQHVKNNVQVAGRMWGSILWRLSTVVFTPELVLTLSAEHEDEGGQVSLSQVGRD